MPAMSAMGLNPGAIIVEDAAILVKFGQDSDLAGLIRYMSGHLVAPDR
jgi:hypothetical protein